MPFLTDHLAERIEESTGDDTVAVTLVVNGTVITGRLTKVARYFEWYYREVRKNLGLAPPTPEELNFGRREAPARPSPEPGSGDDQQPDENGSDVARTYATICLQDAEIYGGAPQTVTNGVPIRWVTYPFLLVSAAAVTAMTVATTKPAGFS
jgi:hypothetical protein